ncbi:MAG TPA: hypothetical protein VGR73_12545 [Bryobacteraceae bacterium]|nr:hypothetical protein [Bryobacteraceae bacterium]
MGRLILCVLALAAAALAQDDAKPVMIGGFENQGSATFGYRFTSVEGYRPSFNQMFDLNSGPRLLDFDLFGKAPGDGNRFADDYSLTASGMGGDPFTTTQLTVRKARLYDLRATFSQSRYYWNQDASALLPGGTPGLLNNHEWATVRKLGSVNLLIHASNNLRFSFEYYRNTRDGATFTTRSMDYFGSSSTWGAFARADPYLLIAPVNEEANRVTGGIDYSHRDWTVHYRVGYQSFNDAVTGANVVGGELSLNAADRTTRKEPLNGASWTDFRNLRTPVSEFSYTGKLTRSLEARGSYLFYRFNGPAHLDMSANGVARTNFGGTTDAPYAFSETANATVSEPNNVIDQGFTYKVKEWWDILADYRYSRFSVNSTGVFSSVNATAEATGTSLEQWRIGVSTLDFNMAFTPAASMLIRAGVRLMKSDIEALDSGVVDPTRTKRVKTVWPVLSTHYEPSKKLTLRGDIDQITNGTTYTAITPHTDVGGRITVRYRPVEKFYLENSTVVRNRTQLASDFHSTIRSNAVTASYDIHPKVAVYSGFSYDSFYASDFVNFVRGTGPLTNLSLTDQTVNRVWTGGVRAEPWKRLGVNLSGNFIRTTGTSQIAGELPLYGPMSFPYASGSLYYDFPRFGRLTAELQRTYYTEQIVAGDNFSANILTVAWTRSF